MAAGFGFLPEKLEVVTRRLQKIAKEQISLEMLQPSLEVECLLPADLANLDICAALEKFAPFGQHNSQPVFGLKSWKVVSADAMGKEGKHLKMIIMPAEGDASKNTNHAVRPLTVLGWGMGEKAADLAPNTIIDIAGLLDCNEWKGRRSVQMVAKNIVLLN